MQIDWGSGQVSQKLETGAFCHFLCILYVLFVCGNLEWEWFVNGESASGLVLGQILDVLRWVQDPLVSHNFLAPLSKCILGTRFWFACLLHYCFKLSNKTKEK